MKRIDSFDEDYRAPVDLQPEDPDGLNGRQILDAAIELFGHLTMNQIAGMGISPASVAVTLEYLRAIRTKAGDKFERIGG